MHVRHGLKRKKIHKTPVTVIGPVKARRSADIVEDLKTVIVLLRYDDIARLGVDERRIVDETFVEAAYCPLVEEQSTPARSHNRIVRIAVEYRKFARRRLGPPAFSHIAAAVSSEYRSQAAHQTHAYTATNIGTSGLRNKF